MKLFNVIIPQDLINFVLVLVFSLLIGLEQRVHHEEDERYLFGTDRTFTLIGITGFVLYILDKKNMLLFWTGILVLTVLLAVYYRQKMKTTGDFGLTSVFAALLTYSLGPLIYLKSKVLVLSIFVSILILIEIKSGLKRFARSFDESEFLTLSKFIILSGVVLPLLPREPLGEWLPVSLYQIWLAVIAVSGISYLSYILQKFVFPQKGLLLSALLGGLYSSTATTVILARKSKETNDFDKILAAILAATGMMFIRIWILAFIFNRQIAFILLPYLIFLIVFTAGITLFFLKKKRISTPTPLLASKNPLELKTALLFALIFVLFSVLIHFFISRYGQTGMDILAFLTGLTDVDPFILNVLQSSELDVPVIMAGKWIIIAIASNNLMKMLYAMIWGASPMRKKLLTGFGLLILFNFLLLLFI